MTGLMPIRTMIVYKPSLIVLVHVALPSVSHGAQQHATPQQPPEDLPPPPLPPPASDPNHPESDPEGTPDEDEEALERHSPIC